MKQKQLLHLICILTFLFISCQSQDKATANKTNVNNSNEPLGSTTSDNEDQSSQNSAKKTIAYPFDFKQFQGAKFISAHRGGGEIPTYPENAIESFQYMVDNFNAWIECDVRVSKDDVLIMMHDKDLHRTTTGKGMVNEMNWSDIKKLRLIDNDGNIGMYHPPSLEQVLLWNEYKGKTILTLDVKPEVDYKKLSYLLEETQQVDNCIVIVYSIAQAKALHRINKDLVISLPIRGMKEWNRFVETRIPYDRVIAFTGTKRSEDLLYETLQKNNIASIFGSLGNIDRQAKSQGNKVYTALFKQGVDVISTDRPKACYAAIQGLN